MSKHVTIEELLKQIVENTASIKNETTVRAGADEALASHIGAMSTNLPKCIQSHNYVPGVSGWKIDQITDELEINTCTLGSVGGSLERQTVSVEVCSYSKYDLPKNAANLLQFMEAELQKVPEEYRHAAEFEEFDTSYGDESFSPRLFLSYSRLETEEEQADRLEKAKSAGTQIKYESGVTSVFHNGVLRYRLGSLNSPEPEHATADQPAKPFVVVDGKTYLNEAFIKDGAVGSKIASYWSVKMQRTANGQYVAAGIGLGFPSQFLVSADRFSLDIQRRSSEAVQSAFSQILNDTELGKELAEDIGKICLRGKLAELEDKVDALRKDLDQINLERLGEKGNSDGASMLLDRRLASIYLRVANLESNRFRRPNDAATV